MSREQIDRMVAFAERHPVIRRGTWHTFRLREGVTRHSLYHWRKKLGLAVFRKSP